MSSTRSPDPGYSFDSLLLVLLGVDLCDGGGAVAEDDAGGFDAGLLAQLSGRVVADLVRVPGVGLTPAGQRARELCVFGCLGETRKL